MSSPTSTGSSGRQSLARLLLLVLVVAVICSIVSQTRWLWYSNFNGANEIFEPLISRGIIPTATGNNVTEIPAKARSHEQHYPHIPSAHHQFYLNSEFIEFNPDRQEYRIRRSVDKTNIKMDMSSTNHIDARLLCVPWNISGDLWWTHHRDWEAAVENDNDVHYCFRPIQDPVKARYFRQLYQIQFGDETENDNNNNNNNKHCHNLMVQKMWSSGWGADMMNIVHGLHRAYQMNNPVQINESTPWHYAYTKKNVDSSKPERKAACPEKSMYCYLLNMTNCRSSSGPNNNTQPLPSAQQQDIEHYWWYMEFLVRPQTWLRKRVYDFIQKQPEQFNNTPCTVMHVRRNDVVLHDQQARKFHPISEYVTAANNSTTIRPNILLLTDDHNALGEATAQYPQYNWMFIDRPRFQGVGGWEHQIPSDDPTFEVVVLFATFQLVRSCDQIILSTGKFSDYLYAEMKRDRPSTAVPVNRVNIDEVSGDRDSILSGTNVKTNVVSQRFEPDKPNLLGKKTLTLGGEYNAMIGEPLARNKEFEGPFCLSWDVNADDWWTHHVNWEMGDDNETHFCFKPIAETAKAALFENIYRIQYPEENCNNVLTQRMSSIEYGADLTSIADGLVRTLQTRQPLQVSTAPWHYANIAVTNSQANAIACPKRTMFCYFLDLSRCPPQPELWDGDRMVDNDPTAKSSPKSAPDHHPWLLEYIARPQTWLRKEIADFVRKQKYFQLPCTVLHIPSHRKHYSLETYLNFATQTRNITLHNSLLLVTDDQNVIDEAEPKHPQYHWMSIERPRLRSSPGDTNINDAVQHQLASNDPVFEMVVLQSTLRMAQQCDQLIHASSSSDNTFIEILQRTMEFPGHRPSIVRINFSDHDDHERMAGD